MLGFVFVILGAASVLLPMFALAHDLKLHLARLRLSLIFWLGFCWRLMKNLAIFAVVVAALLFIAQAFYILKSA